MLPTDLAMAPLSLLLLPKHCGACLGDRLLQPLVVRQPHTAGEQLAQEERRRRAERAMLMACLIWNVFACVWFAAFLTCVCLYGKYRYG